MIRRVEFDALLVVARACEAGAELVERRRTSCRRRWTRTASRSWRAMAGASGADRDRRRRRAQRRRAAARDSTAAGRATSVALDMMEETPRDDAARRRSVDAVGGVRLRPASGRGPARATDGRRRRLRVHLSEARSRQRRHRLRARTHYRRDRSTRLRTSCSGRSSIELRRTGHRRGRIGARQLHAVPHSGRRPAAASRPWPGAAGRRRRRVRQRLHGGGHLLRDGVGRARRTKRRRVRPRRPGWPGAPVPDGPATTRLARSCEIRC